MVLTAEQTREAHSKARELLGKIGRGDYGVFEEAKVIGSGIRNEDDKLILLMLCDRSPPENHPFPNEYSSHRVKYEPMPELNLV